MFEPSLRGSLLLLRVLLLEILLRLRDSLGLQTLNEMSVSPSELAGEVTHSDVGTIGSTHYSSSFPRHLPQVRHTVGSGHNHALLLVVGSRHSVEALQVAQSIASTRGLVGNHSAHSTLEDLRGSALMIATTRRVGVHLLTKICLTAHTVTHHYSIIAPRYTLLPPVMLISSQRTHTTF